MNLKKMERYLRVNLLGPGPRLMKKKNLPGRGLTKFEKHWFRVFGRVGKLEHAQYHAAVSMFGISVFRDLF